MVVSCLAFTLAVRLVFRFVLLCHRVTVSGMFQQSIWNVGVVAKKYYDDYRQAEQEHDCHKAHSHRTMPNI